MEEKDIFKYGIKEENYLIWMYDLCQSWLKFNICKTLA